MMGTVHRSAGASALVFVLSVAAACGEEGTGPTPSLCDDEAAVALTGGGCLVVSGDPAIDPIRAELESWVVEVVGRVSRELDVSGVEIHVGGPGNRIVPGGFGVGGFATAEQVLFEVDPSAAIRPEGLRAWVEQVMAHELHHVARLRTDAGREKTVAALVVLEGMADHYALAFGAGVTPTWSTALQGADLEHWTDRVLDEHPQPDYSVHAWMFGTTPEIPMWTGYSVGFEIVGRFLERTGATAAAGVGVGADAVVAAAR